MQEYLIATFYVVMIIINIAIVTVVYYDNYVTVHAMDEINSLSPQKLCQHLYEALRKPPEAFTYDKLANGKYVIYRLEVTSNMYRRSVEDYPVDVDGHQWIPQSDKNSEITYTKTGFKIPAIPNELTCPFRWYWDQNQGKCVESPLCPNFDDSILPLLNAYYTEIINPATTLHTKLTDQLIHKKLYIQCAKDEKKPVIKACSENTFVKMSTEPFDENKITHIPALKNGQPNVDALCKRYDVCENRLEGSIHRLLISDDSDTPLGADEYFICKNGKSVKKKCDADHKVNPDLEHTSGHVCVPVDRCDHHRDFYFRINDDAYGYCQANVEHIVPCDSRGIFIMPDESIECRGQECLGPNKTLVYNDHIFSYAFGITSCFEGNKLKRLSCDQMFDELTTDPKLLNISLPRRKINRTTSASADFKEFYEDHEIKLPTKFYYDTEKEECVRFKQDGIKDFLIQKKMIKDDAVIYKSTSYRVKSLPFNLIKDVMILDPKKFGYKNIKNVYAIYDRKIYWTSGDNYEGKPWSNKNSDDYYSFISPIAKQPKEIGTEIEILKKVSDEKDGINYALCIKHTKKFEIAGQNVPSHVDYESLKLVYPELGNLPQGYFSQNKIFVGKYFYDVNTGSIVIWHDYLFVLKLVEPKIVIKKEVNSDGQFIVDNFVDNIIPSIYNDNDNSFKNWSETALVTTFNYFGEYFDEPVPFWLSFINIPVDKLSEDNILKSFRIVYPTYRNEDVEKGILLSIIKLNPLVTKIKNKSKI